MENDKLWRLIRNRATTGRHSSAHSPHREQIISLGRPGCRHHRGVHDGLESMTTFAGICTQTLKVSTTAMESSDCCGRRRVMARQRPTTGSLEPGIAPIDVSLRSPTWPHIPRKFTRPSHLGSAFAPNCLFSSPGSGARVGSIPIARSTFRCLACPCVVLGRARAYCPILTSRCGYNRPFGDQVCIGA
jgi:hypothetical protein